MNALGMLPAPKLANPTGGRATQGRCMWCGKEATLNLGPRLKVVDGELHRWTPRACEPCTRAEAGQVYAGHRTTCARCAELEHCLDARALYALAHGRPDGLIREG
ncbi:hypothetical protein [Streptomyces turgidiscabies]|uniref:hypothetical protein n=1 Tax=Streptomyces turgidiscabies TaxID=85558 RepID=UPI0038F6849A